LHISAKNIIDHTAPYELVSTMRASFWCRAAAGAHGRGQGVDAGRLRHRHAAGRPADHGAGELGAEIEIEGGYVIARAKNGLRGAEIKFPKVTVSGTHVALMAAVLAKGTTVIDNAAREPEIGDVADCLNKMGAKVTASGRLVSLSKGVARLNGTRHAFYPTASKPHLCNGRRHDRRRRIVAEHAARTACSRRSECWPRPAPR